MCLVFILHNVYFYYYLGIQNYLSTSRSVLLFSSLFKGHIFALCPIKHGERFTRYYDMKEARQASISLLLFGLKVSLHREREEILMNHIKSNESLSDQKNNRSGHFLILIVLIQQRNPDKKQN